jgi:hypothetical protein
MRTSSSTSLHCVDEAGHGGGGGDAIGALQSVLKMKTTREMSIIRVKNTKKSEPVFKCVRQPSELNSSSFSKRPTIRRRMMLAGLNINRTSMKITTFTQKSFRAT